MNNQSVILQATERFIYAIKDFQNSDTFIQPGSGASVEETRQIRRCEKLDSSISRTTSAALGMAALYRRIEMLQQVKARSAATSNC